MTERERELLGWIRENPMISQQELAERAGITRSSVAVHISNLMKKGLIRGKGYVLQTSPYVAVCGGMNMDIFGRPSAPLVACDSNPGQVRISFGGVGRNIAHNLSLLGTDVKLITAFGEDIHAEELRRSCRELGVDVTAALTVAGAATSTYLFITNHLGDMQLAVSDMDIYDAITPDFLAGRMDFINRAQLCVADTNLPQATLEYLAQSCRCPLFVDPVSTAKAEKLRGLLRHIHTLKPNMLEAELLTGCRTPDAAAARLLAQGVQRVFLTLGDAGVLYADRREMALLPCLPGGLVNTTGAGDSFVAALAWAYLQDLPLRTCAAAGLAAAAICLESEETISPDMSARTLLERIGSAAAQNE